MTITPPFAKYHRAKLGRLVMEGFEAIEKEAASQPADWYELPPPMNMRDFQLLCAADYYLRTTTRE